MMGKFSGKSICTVLLLVCCFATVILAIVASVIYGFRSHVALELLAASELFLLLAVCVFCKLLLEGRGVKIGEYHVVAPVMGCDVFSIPMKERINFDTCASAITSNGRRLDIDVGKYEVFSGTLTGGASLPSNHIAFAVHFPAFVDRKYFDILQRRRQPRSKSGGDLPKQRKDKAQEYSISIEPGDKDITVAVCGDFRDHAVEYLLYSMALSDRLNSGEGIKFFKWYCCCCLGMARIHVPFYHDALDSVESASFFCSFPGAWLAVHKYESVFRRVVEYSRGIRREGISSRSNLCLSEKEENFLERLCNDVGTYNMDERECVYAERELTHMLTTMHIVSSPAMFEVFSHERLYQWLNAIMLSDFGSRECAIHVAMSSFGFARFDGTLIKSTYQSLCRENRSTFGKMGEHMTDFLNVSSDHVTDETISDVVDRKGLEFFAVSVALVPYFHKTRAHKSLLKNESYRDVVSDIVFRIKNFDSMNNPVPSEGSILGILCYHEGVSPFLGNYDWDLEGYVSYGRSRVRHMLTQFATLEAICGANMWKDPSVLKFFVKLAVWIWDSKELSLTRRIKPMVSCVCSVWNVFKRYFHQYWVNSGVDVLMPAGEDGTHMDSMLKDRIRVEFRMIPYEESLVVGRNAVFEIIGAFAEKEEHRRVAPCVT